MLNLTFQIVNYSSPQNIMTNIVPKPDFTWVKATTNCAHIKLGQMWNVPNAMFGFHDLFPFVMVARHQPANNYHVCYSFRVNHGPYNMPGVWFTVSVMGLQFVAVMTGHAVSGIFPERVLPGYIIMVLLIYHAMQTCRIQSWPSQHPSINDIFSHISA